MNRADMLPHLQRWAEVVAEISAVDDELEALTSRAPEGRLTRAMWSAVGAYTRTLETLLIGSPNSEWLEWYWIENEMGERALSVTTESGERPIASLEALADLLTECLT